MDREIAVYLASEPFGRDAAGVPIAAATWLIAEVVYGHHGDDDVRRPQAQSTHAQRTSVRRALGGLERAGVVLRESFGYERDTYWRVAVSSKPPPLD